MISDENRKGIMEHYCHYWGFCGRRRRRRKLLSVCRKAEREDEKIPFFGWQRNYACNWNGDGKSE